ncbi:beta-lactamase family protein [Mucilaginibacter corticis]|uniref:Beta-lactamase family protein n=1 Tax=Mucilaginibacter corticis TaxID=2597670 RepID=A0A556MWT0_9SPHI|nr:serine hydrolase domain-containing protein [Mucilaginibacter corticis]TSJ44367.1 beta-lactamase family protein [Mucilaginibacter corticis]
MIWSHAFGYANMTKDVPADTGNIYRIGSITKTFTATLLMQLVEEGKVKLDDPAEKYVPEVKTIAGYAADTKFTLKQLASHTSGLKREPDTPGFDVGPIEKWQDKLISLLPKTAFNSKPDKQQMYSNIGFAILGLALERATGVPYIQMVQQRIFKPLHMNNSFFVITPDKLPHLAQGISNYREAVADTVRPVTELAGRGYKVPNGGIFTTIGDLSKFAISMMVKPYLLKASSLQQMQEVPKAGKNYGLGLAVFERTKFMGHSGGVPGYTSVFFIDKDTRYAVILMYNYNVYNTNPEKTAIDLLKKLKD